MIEKQTLSTRLIKRAANLLTFSPSTDKADYPWIPFYYFRMIDGYHNRARKGAILMREAADRVYKLESQLTRIHEIIAMQDGGRIDEQDAYEMICELMEDK